MVNNNNGWVVDTGLVFERRATGPGFPQYQVYGSGWIKDPDQVKEIHVKNSESVKF